MTRRGSDNTWKLTREKILMTAGLLLIAASFIVTEVLRGPFHIEFLLAGCALCGISITQWKDRNNGDQG
jgi:hypothetical protein